MWIPENADHLERAARDGLLTEKARFEAKAQLPEKKRNVGVAIDVSAMTVDGGLVIYGIAEDEHRRPTVPSPITLAGARERIDSIVGTLVDEVPDIEIEALALDDEPARGYVVVIVPQSARAPHQVAVKGEYRYYGRSDTGNRILTEREVARLYHRREEWDVDRGRLLDECIARSAHGASSEPFAFLHAFAQPVVPDPGMWDRAAAKHEDWFWRLRTRAAQVPPHSGYVPGLRVLEWEPRGADAFTLDGGHENLLYAIRCDVNIDGRGYLFSSRAGERHKFEHVRDGRDRMVVHEDIVAGNFATFLAIMGELYTNAGYRGQVDIGVAVMGIEDGFAQSRINELFAYNTRRFGAQSYTRTARIAASELKAPEVVARRLLGRFFDALVGPEYDPFSPDRHAVR